MRPEPHHYQHDACEFILQRLFIEDRLGAGIWADPGLGKTFIALLAAEKLFRYGIVKRILVVAPIDPCYLVWPVELKKLDFDLSMQVIHDPNERKRFKNAQANAQIHVINFEGLAWLEKNKIHRWDMLIVDESTRIKNWTAQRTKVLRKMLPRFKKRLLLTGTPMPNSYEDLFAQSFVMDDGARLGKTITYFRKKYRMWKDEYHNYHWNGEYSDEVKYLLSDLVMRIDEKDHLDLPELKICDHWVKLDRSVMSRYRQAEKELFFELDEAVVDDGGVIIGSAGAKYAACSQIANGGLYENENFYYEDTYGTECKKRVRVATHHIHDSKTKRLAELTEEFGGRPSLIAYQYDHDRLRLEKKFPRGGYLYGGVSREETQDLVSDWNEKRLQHFFVQPQRASHGLNLQHGGNDLIWYGLSDNPETYQQFNKRIHRQGVVGTVRQHHILASGTVDEMKIQRLRDKGSRQMSLLDAVKKYRYENQEVSNL